MDDRFRRNCRGRFFTLAFLTGIGHLALPPSAKIFRPVKVTIFDSLILFTNGAKGLESNRPVSGFLRRRRIWHALSCFRRGRQSTAAFSYRDGNFVFHFNGRCFRRFSTAALPGQFPGFHQSRSQFHESCLQYRRHSQRRLSLHSRRTHVLAPDDHDGAPSPARLLWGLF